MLNLLQWLAVFENERGFFVSFMILEVAMTREVRHNPIGWSLGKHHICVDFRFRTVRLNLYWLQGWRGTKVWLFFLSRSLNKNQETHTDSNEIFMALASVFFNVIQISLNWRIPLENNEKLNYLQERAFSEFLGILIHLLNLINRSLWSYSMACHGYTRYLIY